ncbi:helix-turn-helix domain-containing protein [Desulfosediminicola sp.]|uniref:helix-turn-helix domain-containing protein n=1 Tax=Desulfosediminicola sp. TaxID=2886825 RepID=UPI003AF22850
MPSPSKKPQFCMVPAGAITDRDLKPRDIHVLCMLARNADRNGHTVRSQARMAQELEWARSTVQTAVKNLIAAGWLTRVENIRPDCGDCSHGYIIHREKGLASDRPNGLSTPGAINSTKAAPPADPAKQGVPPQSGTYKINSSRPNNKKPDNKDTRDYLDEVVPVFRTDQRPI